MKTSDKTRESTADKEQKDANVEKDAAELQGKAIQKEEEEGEEENRFGGMQAGNFKKNLGCGG